MKGLNWLYVFKGFDIIKSIGIDYMHLILFGVVKKLLEAWFSSKFKLKPWYIWNSVSILDKKLRNIKHRMLLAESLEASMTLNNGRHQNTEIFYFFIQYQFCGKHCQIFTISIFLCLVEAIHILLSESISKEAFQKGIIAF